MGSDSLDERALVFHVLKGLVLRERSDDIGFLPLSHAGIATQCLVPIDVLLDVDSLEDESFGPVDMIGVHCSEGESEVIELQGEDRTFEVGSRDRWVSFTVS